MIFCYATFAKVLNLSKPSLKNPTQRELQNKILSSVYDSYISAGITDSVSTDLLKGKQGLSDEVIGEARSIIENGETAKVAEYFKKRIIDANYIKSDESTIVSIVLALLDIIRNDTGISDEIVIDKVSGKTKKALLSQSQFVLSDFLAGLFLYAVTAVSNKDTQECSNKINAKFINEAKGKNTRDIKVFLSASIDGNETAAENARDKRVSSTLPLIEALASFNDAFAEADALLSSIKYPLETAEDGVNLDESVIEYIRTSFCEKTELILAVNPKMRIKDEMTQEFFDMLDTFYNYSAYEGFDGEAYGPDELFEEEAFWFDYSDYSDSEDEEDITEIATEYDISRWNNKFEAFLKARQFIKQYIVEFAKNLEMVNEAGAFGNYLAKLKTEYSKMRIFISGDEERDFYSFYVPNDICCNFPGFGERLIEEPTAQIITSISSRTIITGTGGLGKSTMMVHLLLNAIDNYAKLRLAPVFARLTEFGEKDKSLEDFLYKEVKSFDKDISEDEFTALLNEAGCLLLLDGWDEIGVARIERFEDELNKFVKKYPDCKYVISTRPFKKFVSYHSKFVELHLQPFNLEEAVIMVKKLKFRTSTPMITENFVASLESGLFYDHVEFAGNPLLLSIMLLVFGRTSKIPTQTYKFYKEAFDSLAERHDSSKGFDRKFKSGLTKEQFEEYLAEICLRSYDEERYELKENEFKAYYNDLQTVDAVPRFADFLFDIRTNLCLMYTDGDTNRFIHRSFQEYFAAVFLDQAFAKVSAKNKQGWSDFLIGFFERRGNYGNKVLDMLYEMSPEKVEEYVFIPFLENLFAEIDDSESGNYYSFLEKLCPTLKMWHEYQETEDWDDETGEEIMVPHYDFNLGGGDAPETGILCFIVRSVLGIETNEESEEGDWPYDLECVVDKIPLVVAEFQRVKDEERDTHELVKDESAEYQTPFKSADIRVYSDFYTMKGNHWSTDGYYFTISDILKKADKYPNLLSLIDSDDFPAKKICKIFSPQVRKYLQSIKSKQKKTDNSYFDLLKPMKKG